MRKLLALLQIVCEKILHQNRIVNIASTDDLNGKVILISGASHGVGLAAAKLLHKRGAHLCVIGRNQEKLDKAFENYKDVLRVTCDVSIDSQVSDAVKKCEAHFGRIDVLINMAGVFLDKPVSLISESELDTLMQTNIKSMFLTAKYCVPIMKRQKYGLIVNMGSKISHNTNVAKNKTAYAASKYAIEGFSLALRNELAKTGIRVTCLLPATIDTFPSFRSREFLITEEIAAVIAMVIVQDHTVFEQIQLQSIDQQL